MRSAALSVDPANTAEADRFWSHVVCGPGTECWLWTGAISDDGYGRFYARRRGRNVCIRPHRWTVAATVRTPLSSADLCLHTCDEPLCVRCEPGPGSHLRVGTQRENLLMMARAGRGGGPAFLWTGAAMMDRQARYARSRALRAAVRHGWDQAAVTAARQVAPTEGQLLLPLSV